MKRFLLCVLIVCLALSLCACGHSGSEICINCKKCRNPECDNKNCTEKCEGHKEEAYVFEGGDFITDSELVVETDKLTVKIDANTYVRGNFEEMLADVVDTMEKVTGISFTYDKWFEGKTSLGITRGNEGNAEELTGPLKYSEFQFTPSASLSGADVCTGDLFIIAPTAIIHELSHSLMFRREIWNHSQILNEGFAEYTDYRVLQELDKIQPRYSVYMGSPEDVIDNMGISDYSKLYEYPLEYWFDNYFEYAGNGNYTIGFRFMAYLDEVYGDYCKWVTLASDIYPPDFISHTLTTEQQIDVLKQAYGEEVIDNFYPWLQANEERFKALRMNKVDVEGVKSANWYPEFHSVHSRVILDNINYSDLYLNLESTRMYLGEYKNADITNLVLNSSQEAIVNLYAADGTYSTVKITRKTPVSLEGVSYIKLVGSGYIWQLEITGFVLPE